MELINNISYYNLNILYIYFIQNFQIYKYITIIILITLEFNINEIESIEVNYINLIKHKIIYNNIELI